VQLQAKLNEFKKLKAEVVSISSDSSQTARSTKASLGLSFDVLADPEKKTIKLYSVLHPEERIARPAVFVIDKKGVVRYLKIGKDAADRPKTTLLLNVLRWL
jgi:peroxiredoxin